MRLESRTRSEEAPRNRNTLTWMMGELRTTGKEKEANSMIKESTKKKVTTKRKTKNKRRKRTRTRTRPKIRRKLPEENK